MRGVSAAPIHVHLMVSPEILMAQIEQFADAGAELQARIGAEVSGQHIVLDLRDVTLVGQDGIIFLAACVGIGITLANCPPYVREWITRQRESS